MILYHGTNTDIDEIDLAKGHRYKDFGQGFYLTPSRDTAVRMARKKANLFGGKAYLIEYEFDYVNAAKSNLNLKSFSEKATPEWFLFVESNRDRNLEHPVHNYDIVVGPIADDGVVLQITNYRGGYISVEQAANLLQDKYLDLQYYFGTQISLTYLHKISATAL